MLPERGLRTQPRVQARAESSSLASHPEVTLSKWPNSAQIPGCRGFQPGFTVGTEPKATP